MRLLKNLSQNLRSFVRDNRGVAAIEFGFGLPVFVTMIMGFMVLMQIETKSAEVARVTSTMGDIMAQSRFTNKEAIDRSMRAGLSVVGPTICTKLESYMLGIEIADVNNDPDNPNYRPLVRWGHGQNISTINPNFVLGQQYTAKPDIGLPAMPAGMLTKPGYVLVAVARYQDSPTFVDEILDRNGTAYTYANFFIPRSTDRTDCTDCNNGEAAQPLCTPSGS